MNSIWMLVLIFGIVMFFLTFIQGPKLLSIIKEKKSKNLALIGMLGGWGIIILIGIARTNAIIFPHPVWLFVLIFSIVMLFMSIIELPRWSKYVPTKSSKMFILVSVLGCWGCLILIAMARAGFLN